MAGIKRTIRIDPRQINSVIRDLRKRVDEIESAVRNGIESAVDQQASEADALFKSPPGYDGFDTAENMAAATPLLAEGHSGVKELFATGPSVTFIEFGSGWGAGTAHYGTQAGGMFQPGSWSRTLGSGQFANNGYWMWNGNRYEAQIPVAPMLRARHWLQFYLVREILNRL